MRLELIYFKACPFAQRTLIVLNRLGLEFTKTLINPMDKPAWMMEVSPMGQIPLLRVGESTVLFDSSVICEYLNERASGGLLPDNPLTRATYRGLIEFAGECQMNFAGLIAAPNQEAFNQTRDGVLKKLRWLETLVDEQGPLFSGSALSLVDVAYAPLFLRMQHLYGVTPFYQPEEFPRLSRWRDRVLAEQSVQESVDGDFAQIFRMVVKGRGKGGFVDSIMG
ncbi:MAG: glutathione S-transferase family protein [Magnetococcales bacterium]|nr:glutathione S-transferase family protein [Magnetococcales bacterium]